ncbi:MAG: MOSC domain-containing protein [Planctomycetota bacterium]|nr:MOSC domain-containing protein [Planctomycetota bacterium]
MIVGIYTKPKAGVTMTRHTSINCEAGYGLEGDMYGDRAREQGGTVAPMAQVTMTSAEAMHACKVEYDLLLRPQECRRNLITVGVALNALVGKTFKVGDSVVLKGIELCEPCGTLEKLTGLKGLVKAMQHRGGLRCQIIESGELREGDAFEIG